MRTRRGQDGPELDKLQEDMRNLQEIRFLFDRCYACYALLLAQCGYLNYYYAVFNLLVLGYSDFGDDDDLGYYCTFATVTLLSCSLLLSFLWVLIQYCC